MPKERRPCFRIGHICWHFNRCAAHTLGNTAASAVLPPIKLAVLPAEVESDVMGLVRNLVTRQTLPLNYRLVS